ncbi:putative sulfate exporter family transporter [Bacteriovorax stolpii]|uniref:Putative sulfate exporter family transporter n=1 Tax=Bacteriovorax stolpii TaxID=960 RepID=A0A2K9NRA7_BACTC|nr:putative sulfate exporter family transporter [Bacteriovorax stolpii]AUN98049.1 putative sulfate exporter family transporter [Bacteriovorax stolpii]TDP50260.1 putative integral membrane protein (TIGR00698 family) [Bacteriovorax stolpii]
MKTNLARFVFFALVLFALSPYSSSALALLAGIILASTLGNPFPDFTKKHTSTLLQYSVVGLGAGMNLKVVGVVGAQGVGYTITGIALTALVGYGLSRLLKTPNILSTLITVGTAICGGSAIAATGPIIKAEHEDMSVSLGVVFILNACALFIFPPIGHYLGLTQHQFGIWSALAIHDTSSVVGASMQYGAEALELATTVKLARALWIIPISLLFAFFMKSKSKIKMPWFIFGFILVAALVTWVPAFSEVGHQVSRVAKQLLVLTLFFIGINLNLDSIKRVGIKPLLLGFILWVVVATTTVMALKLNWII